MTEAGPTDGTQARILALAGLFQALRQVNQIAGHGEVEDPAAYAASLNSVLLLDADSTEAVFGGRAALRPGLEWLERYLSGRPSAQENVTRYCIAVLVLERKLSRRRALREQLRQGLEEVGRERLEANDDRLAERLAELYKQTISTLTPRVMVSGQPRNLNDPVCTSRIRALLLAAVRAAVLWRQLGGTRLGLLFSRPGLARAARALLDADAEDRLSDPGQPGES